MLLVAAHRDSRCGGASVLLFCTSGVGAWSALMDVLKESVSSSDNDMVLSCLTLINKV